MKYIQSVQRACDILELVSEKPNEPRALGDIARAAGLHPATCSHLVNTLVERGYVQQAGPRQGYQLGPMAYYLVRHGAFRSDLVTRAEPLLRRTAEELGEWIVLAALAGTRRMVLLEVSGAHSSVRLDRQAVRLAEHAYNAASTWVFLANMRPADKDRFVDRHGFPPGHGDVPSLDARLQKVRCAGHAIHEDPADEVAKVAFPVTEDGTVTAAVGVYLPAFRFQGDHGPEILRQTALLAERISS